MSDEQRLKIKLSKQGKGNGREGYSHSEETKAKMRKAAEGRDVSHLNWTGKTHTPETRRKLSEANRKRAAEGNHPLIGFKFSEESKLRMRESHLGQLASEETRKKLSESRTGEKHWNWKSDRTQLSKNEKKHLCGHYKMWMLGVKNRDNWKCQMENEDCSGKLEAHHILSWREYPKLRYHPNNGITLCHAHHPRGRVKEKRLEPIFIEMIKEKTSVSIKMNQFVSNGFSPGVR